MNSRVSLPKLAKGPKKKKRNNKKKEKNSSVHLPAISTSSKDHNAERCTRKNSLLDYIASTKITSQLPSTIMEQEGSKSFRKYYKEVPLTPVTKGLLKRNGFRSHVQNGIYNSLHIKYIVSM